MGDGRPEERHDAVAGVLVDRALEAVHAVRQDLEEAVEDPVPLLGVDLLGQLHRALDVGEEHRHLLALALQGGLGLEDLVGQVLRGVVAGLALGGGRLAGGNRRAALEAEAGSGGKLGVAARAAHREGRAALQAELRALRVLVSAGGAVHDPSSFASRLA